MHEKSLNTKNRPTAAPSTQNDAEDTLTAADTGGRGSKVPTLHSPSRLSRGRHHMLWPVPVPMLAIAASWFAMATACTIVHLHIAAAVAPVSGPRRNHQGKRTPSAEPDGNVVRVDFRR